MDIKSLLQNRRTLLTLGGVLLVAVVIGAIYLPGTLFRGALTPTTEISTVSPTITAPFSAIQPISPELTTVTTTTTESTTTESAEIPSNMATPEETADEEFNMAAIDMLSDSTLDGMTTVSTAESELSGLTPGIYTTTTAPTVEGELAGLAPGTYTTTTAPTEEADTSTLAVAGDSSTLSELTYSGNLSVINEDTFTISPDLSPAAETATEYTLNCDAVSLSDMQDFRAGREMQWKAEITPAVSQTIIYTWSGNGLLSTSGNPVNALYDAAGTYYVTATATPANIYITNVTGPITEPIFDRCSVEILPAEQTSTSDALPTGTLSMLDSSNDISISPIRDVTTTTEDQTVTYSLTEEEVYQPATYSLTEEEVDQTVTYSLTGEEVVEDEVAETTLTQQETPATTTPATETTPAVVTTTSQTTTPATETTPATATTTTTTTIAAPAQNLSKCDTPYPDDIAGHWAEAYIKKGYDECLFTGIDGKFHPDWEIYRMEAASMILYSLGMEPNLKCFDNDCGTPFIDLPSPKEGAVIQPLFLEGLIEGYSNTLFKPKGFLTRAEGASMIVRAFFEPFGRPCTDPHCGAGWPDNFFYDIHDQWQGQYIRVLWDKEILTGSGPNRVDPNNYITRAEMAKMIVLAHEQAK